MCPDDRRRRSGAFQFFGLLIVIWGLLTLFDNLGFMSMRYVLRNYWSVWVVVWGVSMLVIGRRSQRVFGLLLTCFGSLHFASRFWGWHINVFTLFWPLLLIAIGVHIMMRGGSDRWASRRHRFAGTRSTAPDAGAPASTGDQADPSGAGTEARDDRTSPSSTLREFALLGGVERRNTSQTFQGGDVTAVLGGVEIDLRDCRMADSGAHLDVFACMGGISLRVPRNWTVESRVSAILGGFDDRSSPPVDGSAARLVISGQAIMGGVEIRN